MCIVKALSTRLKLLRRRSHLSEKDDSNAAVPIFRIG